MAISHNMSESGSMLDRVKEEVELLSRHIDMLKLIKELQPIGIIRLSEVLGLPKHKVRYSLRLLEKDGLILATTDGAKVSENYGEFMQDLPKRLDGLIEQLESIRSESFDR